MGGYKTKKNKTWDFYSPGRRTGPADCPTSAMAGERFLIHRHPHTHSCYPNDVTYADCHLLGKKKKVGASEVAAPCRPRAYAVRSKRSGQLLLPPSSGAAVGARYSVSFSCAVVFTSRVCRALVGVLREVNRSCDLSSAALAQGPARRGRRCVFGYCGVLHFDTFGE